MRMSSRKSISDSISSLISPDRSSGETVRQRVQTGMKHVCATCTHGTGNTPAKDYIYRSVLHAYVEQLLLTAAPIEFYVEGTRTRTGRPLVAKSGLFSVLMEAHLHCACACAFV
jgi:hypothetical protein